MPETTMETGDERLDPRELARRMAVEAAEDADGVGDFVEAIEAGDGVTDFRFVALLRGYEGWQWSVTMFHDAELDRWTVNESTLVPTDQALRPPPWVPWKDRLLPTDLSVTDSIGTQPDDPRLEPGMTADDIAAMSQQGSAADDAASQTVTPDVAAEDVATENAATETDAVAEGETAASTGEAVASAANDSAANASDTTATETADDNGETGEPATIESSAAETGAATASAATAVEKSADSSVDDASADVAEPGTADTVGAADSADSADTGSAEAGSAAADSDPASTSPQDVDDVVSEFDLSRRHVLSPLGRAQTAKRWYEGPRGPKSLSTKTASGNLCSTCGFFVPIKGELGDMFGVCANKWSPDDGKVVSLDHGCGEHSEIDPPQPSHIWIQSKPAFDDLHIDIVAQAPRDERADVELIEQAGGTSRKRRRKQNGAANGIILLKSQLPLDE